jgi:ferredoxin-NADP reductase
VLSLRDETSRARGRCASALTEPRHARARGSTTCVRLTAARRVHRPTLVLGGVRPDDTGEIELTVEELEDGEVSGYLHGVVEPGDELEVRGPIGGYFAWAGATPALLVGGGSGVVPLMAMLRQARRAGAGDLLRVVVSARTAADLYYADELPGPETTVVLTRTGRGRLTVDDLAPLVRGGEDVFVCGSPGFCDAVTDLLVEAGVPVESIRTERFGPSG